MKKDYYETLGVARDADADTIKKAYRKLARKYHPDSNGGNARAAERFKEINEAYGVLGDEKKRKLYDRFGAAAFDGSAPEDSSFWKSGGTRSGAYRDSQGGYHEFHFGDTSADMDDLLKNLFGGGGFVNHSSGFGRKGSDLHTTLEVSLEEAAFGTVRRVQLQEANGRGRTLEVNIPAGIASGKIIRLQGKGNPGAGNGKPGDLLITVQVQQKEGWRREGQDLYTTAGVPLETLVLGGEVKIHTLYGDVLCRIREGTQSGSRIRLRGKGLVSVNAPSVRGDQYVTVQAQIPQNLSPGAKQKFREFMAACSGRHFGGGRAA